MAGDGYISEQWQRRSEIDAQQEQSRRLKQGQDTQDAHHSLRDVLWLRPKLLLPLKPLLKPLLLLAVPEPDALPGLLKPSFAKLPKPLFCASLRLPVAAAEAPALSTNCSGIVEEFVSFRVDLHTRVRPDRPAAVTLNSKPLMSMGHLKAWSRQLGYPSAPAAATHRSNSTTEGVTGLAEAEYMLKTDWREGESGKLRCGQ